MDNYEKFLEEVIKPENIEKDLGVNYVGICPKCKRPQYLSSLLKLNKQCSSCDLKEAKEKIKNDLVGMVVKDIVIDEYKDFVEILLEKDKKQIKVYIEDYYGESDFELAYKLLSEEKQWK